LEQFHAGSWLDAVFYEKLRPTILDLGRDWVRTVSGYPQNRALSGKLLPEMRFVNTVSIWDERPAISSWKEISIEELLR
jgi:hypothetical protein